MFKVNEKIGSKYRFVILCAQRSKQLLEGADPRVEATCTKPAAIAFQEVISDKVTWNTLETQPPILPETTQTIEVEVGG